MERDRFLSWWQCWVFASPPCIREGYLFLGPTTILEHQVVGVPTGTGSIIPYATSWSRSSFTFFFQWSGIGTGVWITGIIISRVNIMSNPVIVCKGWCWAFVKCIGLKVIVNPLFQLVPIGFCRKEQDGTSHQWNYFSMLACASGYFLSNLCHIEMRYLGWKIKVAIEVGLSG